MRTALRAAGPAGAWLGLIAVIAVGALTLAPRALGWSPLVVRSGSMGEAVPVGSLVVVRPVKGDAVRTGDLIVVRRAGTAVLHRVVALVNQDGQRFVQLKGDANASADPERDPLGAPLAAPVLIVPWAGYAVAALSALKAPLLAIVAGALALRLIWTGGSRTRDRGPSVSGNPS